MAPKDYPEQFLVFKKLGTEIRLPNNKYYLYKVHSEYEDVSERKKNDFLFF